MDPAQKNSRIQTGFELSWNGKRALYKIWTKRGKSQLPPETKIYKMEITTAYPCHAKPIFWISIAFDRGRFVISLKRDITASKSTPSPIHTRWAPKLTLVGKYSVYARLPSYPQPTNIAVM